MGEAVPLKSIAAASCMEAFMFNWVARFGVPETLTSDRGTQFLLASWSFFCSKLGMLHVLTTSYQPQANGLMERVLRQLKDAPQYVLMATILGQSLGPPPHES